MSRTVRWEKSGRAGGCAVAEGLAVGVVGSDTGGYIRGPGH